MLFFKKGIKNMANLRAKLYMLLIAAMFAAAAFMVGCGYEEEAEQDTVTNNVDDRPRVITYEVNMSPEKIMESSLLMIPGHELRESIKMNIASYETALRTTGKWNEKYYYLRYGTDENNYLKDGLNYLSNHTSEVLLLIPKKESKSQTVISLSNSTFVDATFFVEAQKQASSK